jgi:hypothetical protein
MDPACPPDDSLIAQVTAIAEMADGDDTLTGASPVFRTSTGVTEAGP